MKWTNGKLYNEQPCNNLTLCLCDVERYPHRLAPPGGSDAAALKLGATASCCKIITLHH